MAEVHVIGQLTGAKGFKCSALFCKWSLQIGGGWRIIEGEVEGQTQVDSPEIGDNFTWYHPIDIHLTCRGVQGWPRILVQVYRQDDLGRIDLCGYGMIHLPMQPGSHNLSCHTWRPTGNFTEELRRSFLGGGPQLLSTEFIHSASERFILHTTPAGSVDIEIGMIFRNFEKHGILY